MVIKPPFLWQWTYKTSRKSFSAPAGHSTSGSGYIPCSTHCHKTWKVENCSLVDETKMHDLWLFCESWHSPVEAAVVGGQSQVGCFVREPGWHRRWELSSWTGDSFKGTELQWKWKWRWRCDGTDCQSSAACRTMIYKRKVLLLLAGLMGMMVATSASPSCPVSCTCRWIKQNLQNTGICWFSVSHLPDLKFEIATSPCDMWSICYLQL